MVPAWHVPLALARIYWRVVVAILVAFAILLGALLLEGSASGSAAREDALGHGLEGFDAFKPTGPSLDMTGLLGGNTGRRSAPTGFYSPQALLSEQAGAVTLSGVRGPGSASIRVGYGAPETLPSAHEPPVQVPQKPVQSPETVLRAAAVRFGISPDQLVAVARCESGLRADAVGDHGASVGILQFKEATFRANAVRYFGYSVGDLRRDVEASAVVAAWMWTRGQAYQWTCWRTLYS